MKLALFRKETLAWALYDFANTIYSLNILSYYFPLWLTVRESRPEWHYGLVLSLSSLLCALLMPLLGLLTDVLKSRRMMLAVLTLGCIVTTAMMGVFTSAESVLVLFFFSHAFYQMAQVPYNAQLIDLRIEKNMGFISGLGVGVGYVGTITGLLMTRPFFLSGGYRATFVPTAILFLIFALPSMIVRLGSGDNSAGLTKRPTTKMGMYSWRRFFQKVTATNDIKNFALYSFVLLNVIMTLILFMTIFAKKAALLTQEEIPIMIIGSSTAAILGSVILGALSDRCGALGILKKLTVLWALVLLANGFYRIKLCFFAASILAGFALGGTWAVSRVFVLKLVDNEQVGEYYGIFGSIGRLASLSSPLLVSLIFFVFKEDFLYRYDIFNVLLFGLVLISFIFIGKISARQHLNK